MSQYLEARRKFLKQSSIAVAGLAVSGKMVSSLFAATASGVSIVVDSNDTIAGSVPPQWAVSQLQQALTLAGATVEIVSSVSSAATGNLVVVVALAPINRQPWEAP